MAAAYGTGKNLPNINLRPPRRRKKVIPVVCSVVLLSFVTYIIWAYTQPLPTLVAVNTVSKQDQATVLEPSPSVTWSAYGEQAAGVIGHGVMAKHGAQSPLPIASVAKVMVALAVLHQKPLSSGEQGPSIPITTADVTIYQQDVADGQSVAAVRAGENITEYQALQALLLPSANNMATTLTNWAFGSQDTYRNFANSYAKQLGMTQTTFADASGFSQNTVSTPSDLVLLGEAAMQNSVIANIVNQPSAIIPVAGTIQNVDINVRPTRATDQINGIKTGNTDQAGGCFLYSTPLGNTMVVGVILGAPNLGTALRDAPLVAASLRNNLRIDTVLQNDAVVGYYMLPWGGQVNVATQGDMQFLDWSGEHPGISLNLKRIAMSTQHGQVVGEAQATYGGKTKTVQLVLAGTINKPSFWWRMKHPQ